MSFIKEDEIGVFLEAVGHYFSQTTFEKAHVRGAYLSAIDEKPPIYDFTGLITVSGGYRGCIYFSAPRAMLRYLLVAMKEPDQSDENMLDTIGELANTLSGNARKFFGESMDISVPISVAGSPSRITSNVRSRPYIVKINWNGYDASLVIDIERN